MLPFCLDLLAIGIVVSAVFCGHDDWLSRVTPWVAYGCSAGLQVADVWAAGPRGWAVHALPLAAAILGTEKILRLWRPSPVVPLVGASNPGESRATLEQPVDVGLTESTPGQPERKEEVDVAPANTGPLPAPAPVDAPRRAGKRAARPSVRRGGRQIEADPDVVTKVRAAVAELAVPLNQVTRDQILKHLRTHGPAPSTAKVGAALKHLRSTT